MITTLKWVTNVYYPKGVIKDSSINYFLARVDRMLKSSGPVETASYLKDARLALTKFVANEPMRVKRAGQDRFLLPKILPKEVRRKVRAGDQRAISYSLTLLMIGRSILGGTPVDLSSITLSGSAPFEVPLREFIEDKSIRIPRPTFKAFH